MQIARAIPGGRVVIVDETYPSTPEDARRPEFLFPVQTGLEELMWGNIVPTREEQERLLREAGFAEPIDRTLIGEGFTLLSTRKQCGRAQKRRLSSPVLISRMSIGLIGAKSPSL